MASPVQTARTRAVPAVRAPAVVGVVGSVLIAAASWWVGAVPFAWQTHPPAALGVFAIGSIEPRIAFYAGLVLMSGAWLSLGRTVFGPGPAVPARTLREIALAWSAPMMLAVPVASRDLWAYAAQGNLIAHGVDPYRSAPVDLPGVFADNVSPGWVHSAAPYGPFWLGLDHALSAVYRDHVVFAVFLLRLPALVGVLLLLGALPRLAGRTGTRPDRALWLVVVNPFTIELVLAAGHNDLLMAGLMAAAAAIALRDGPPLPTVVVAAAVMALAAGIKSPAALGVAFTVPLVLSRAPATTTRPPWRNVVVLSAAAALSSVVTFAAVSLVTGFGLGWVHQVGSSARLVNWLSLPTDTAIVADVVTGHLRGASRLDDPMRTWRAAGLVAAAVLVLALWLAAVLVAKGDRRPRPEARVDRSAAVLSRLAAALVSLTLLGPAVQLWYLIWALPFLVRVTVRRAALIAVVAVQLAMVFTVDPHGLSFTMKPTVVAIIAAGAVVAWIVLRGATTDSPSPTSAPADDDADRARTGVHADGRRDLRRDELAEPGKPSA